MADGKARLTKRFILTGAPGCGKTSIVRELAAKGHDVVEEAATAVIAEEQQDGEEEPWAKPGFIDKIAARQKMALTKALRSRAPLQFFDRSPICTRALCIYLGFTIPRDLEVLIESIIRENLFERRVLFVANLGFIVPTSARRISFEQSLEFERVHEKSYSDFGYELVRIPNAPVSERVNQVLTLSAISQ